MWASGSNIFITSLVRVTHTHTWHTRHQQHLNIEKKYIQNVVARFFRVSALSLSLSARFSLHASHSNTYTFLSTHLAAARSSQAPHAARNCMQVTQPHIYTHPHGTARNSSFSSFAHTSHTDALTDVVVRVWYYHTTSCVLFVSSRVRICIEHTYTNFSSANSLADNMPDFWNMFDVRVSNPRHLPLVDN